MHAKAAQHPAHATCVVATTLQHTKLTQELTAIHTGQNKQWKEGRIAESGLNPDKAKGASERASEARPHRPRPNLPRAGITMQRGRMHVGF